jgi:hypothetical protein
VRGPDAEAERRGQRGEEDVALGEVGRVDGVAVEVVPARLIVHHALRETRGARGRVQEEEIADRESALRERAALALGRRRELALEVARSEDVLAQGQTLGAQLLVQRARVEIAVARARDERDRARARDEVADLGLARARSDSHRDEPRLLGGHERDVHAGTVGQEHRDAFARREPGAHERGRERIGAARRSRAR